MYPNAPKEQTGAFAFIRVVPDEINDRFWQLVWDVIEGTRQSFFEFRFLVSRLAAGRILADELNKFGPTSSKPNRAPSCDDLRRAPDILVIVGSNHLSRARSHIENGPFARLQLQSLRTILDRELDSTPVQGIAQQIGRTRIILIPDDDGSAQSSDINEITDDTRLSEAIEKLSIFRHGFTFEMARHMLGIADAECERLLTQLSNLKCGDQDCLTLAKGAGEYLLRTRVRQPNSETAARHYSAAKAIAGFIHVDDEIMRLNYRDALSPVWLHEAQWHLRQACEASGPGHPSHRAHERLSRIAELFGWTRIRYATTRSNEDGEELLAALHEHLENVKSRGWSRIGHPIEFVLAAKFAFQLARRSKSVGLRTESLKFFELASQACAELRDKEKDASRYVIATSRACMVLTEAPNGEGLRQAADDILTANQLRPYECELLDFRWFEYMGDREHDPQRAMQEYQSGILNSNLPWLLRPRLPIVLKYMAAASEAGISPPPQLFDKIEEVRNLSQPNLGPISRTGLTGLDHVQRRWKLGRRLFLAGHQERMKESRFSTIASTPTSTGTVFI
ncbi:MAG: hypothetical protein Q8M24_05040 [Pseudolabrys sp.]|nr:hypothetical protein [Pseudolabrys sp.]MDP2294811.1 hypothetical protein [Pseudolabrys sp.]